MPAVRTLALAATTAALLGAASPAAHAGCADDYLASGHRYVLPRQETVSVAGGVVTIDTNAAPGDAFEVVGFANGVVTNESGDVVTFVNCVA
jgi:hypothetical protein